MRKGYIFLALFVVAAFFILEDVDAGPAGEFFEFWDRSYHKTGKDYPMQGFWY